jgi:hypothetical protein
MNTENMNRMLDNWINGNRATARTQAKRTTAEAIKEYLLDRGWNIGRAWDLAAYLKGMGDYQAACNATNDELQSRKG